MNSNTALKTSLACALTLGFASLASTALAAQHDSMAKASPPQQTKAMMARLHYAPCYGINAAYKTTAYRRDIPAQGRIPGPAIPGPSSRCRRACAPGSSAAA